MNTPGGEQPTEIDKAIDLLVALKAARPMAFEQAMARIHSACPDGQSEGFHASALALGLIKGPFGSASSRMLLDLCPSLPRMPSGAWGLVPRTGSKPTSLAAKAASIHGLSGPWTIFFMQAIRDGAMPLDPDCAFDFACRIEEALDAPDQWSSWLGTPDSFHESLGAFFSWPLDWSRLESETRFAALPWVIKHWLHEGGPESFASALGACESLMAHGARAGLSPCSWLEFARPAHAAHAAQSLRAMERCLLLCKDDMASQGLHPCLMFCKLAHPTESMAQALMAVANLDPEGVSHVDSDGLSCLYWLNARVHQHESPRWQNPILDCFSALSSLGADPRSIARQVPLASMANHPRIAAAVEAFDLDTSCSPGCATSKPAL